MTRQETAHIGVSTCEEADDLAQFAFEPGEELVRWLRFGNVRPDEKTWTILTRTFQYTITWLRDRDTPPRGAHHRQYTLWCNETLDRMTVSEAELREGDWARRAEVEN